MTHLATRRNRREDRRTRQTILRGRRRATRAAAMIRRQGTGTLATHAIAAGLGAREAATVAGSLRKNATKAGITGTPGISYRKGRARHCTRYTRAQVAAIAVLYKPRKAAFAAARARFTQAALEVAA